MRSYKTRYYNLILVFILFALSLSGCATESRYFKLDPVLLSQVRGLEGAQYLSLEKVCDAYGFNWKWDRVINTVTIEKKSKAIILRAGSATILVNGQVHQMQSPAVLADGAIFIPVSFVKGEIGPMIGFAKPEVMPGRENLSKKFSIKAIVLDPGHGGKDPGAMGRRLHTREKDMTLRLALKVKNILEGHGLKIIMTRSDDTFIPLGRRASIANKSGADLFISIHINASRSRALRGFECYYLSNATDDNARAIEAFENSSLKLDEGATAERSKQLDKTLWDLTLTENRMESAELASHICDSVEKSLVTSNRGIRTARFYVLKFTTIPAVLVETGYISNKYEELKIRDMKFLGRMAEVIADGILKYKDEYERTEGFTK